jgi:hypothetical protein
VARDPLAKKYKRHMSAAALNESFDPDSVYSAATYRLVSGDVLKVDFDAPEGTQKRFMHDSEYWYRGFQIVHDRYAAVGGLFVVETSPAGHHVPNFRRLLDVVQAIDRELAKPAIPRANNPHAWSAYRDLGRPGAPYPAWVQATKGRNGVYAIRHGAELVYVGESHSDRLYETLTRHFQRWTCDDQRCNTYPRSAVTVSVITTSAAEAPTLQAHTILEREPRDNVYETEESPTDAPF